MKTPAWLVPIISVPVLGCCVMVHISLCTRSLLISSHVSPRSRLRSIPERLVPACKREESALSTITGARITTLPWKTNSRALKPSPLGSASTPHHPFPDSDLIAVCIRLLLCFTDQLSDLLLRIAKCWFASFNLPVVRRIVDAPDHHQCNGQADDKRHHGGSLTESPRDCN
jgi:hypothetical protein